MTLQALLVSKDDDAAEVLSRVLAGFDVAVERFSETEIALQRLGEQRFDSLIVDFDEPDTARQLLQTLPQSKPGALLTMALLSDEGSVRNILQSGAKFILHKPVTPEQAAATLRAATSLLRRERRRSFRVPVQAPVQLSVPGGDQLEGILLDLSQTGMDVLAAQPLLPTALIGLRFTLPDGIDAAELPPSLRALAEVGAHGEVTLRTETPLVHVQALAEWGLGRGLDLPDLDVHRPTLEDVYLSLTE